MTKGEFANLNVGDTVFANFSNQMKQATVAQKTATKALLWANGANGKLERWASYRSISTHTTSGTAPISSLLRF